MKFDIQHETVYRFRAPVFLEPHLIRLHPRQDGTLEGVDQQLSIEPAPSDSTCFLDAQGNVATRAWFAGLVEQFRVRSRLRAETTRANPFDYLLDEAAARPPVELGAERALLAPYLERRGASERVARFARDVAAGAATLDALIALCRRIAGDHEVYIREQGEAHPPEETLAASRGSCRDLAVLFIDCCRSLGIPARFVSGYQAPDGDAERHDLHAWAEVYLPGGGWRGFDATQGVAVDQSYLTLAAAARPADAAPVSGSYRGDAASSMEIRLTVRAATHPNKLVL